jgi:hypothetical protein
MKLSSAATAAALTCLLGCTAPDPSGHPWQLSESSEELVSDPARRDRIFAALDAAASTGTDPSISNYQVRAGTVIHHHGADHAVVGGNSEYAGYPEAIHGETSLMNHVINLVGPEEAYQQVEFLAFFTEGECSGGGSCGDCRDYLMTTTRWKELLMVCGQAGDHAVHVRRFADQVVPESEFPPTSSEEIGLSESNLDDLVTAALEARSGGVSLFTQAEEHLGVAVLSREGAIYRAAGTDDAAFHYRYPVGAALQQAATYRDYLVDTVLVVGAPGQPPRISYRDRQYGYEASSFNIHQGHPPIKLVLVQVDEGSTEGTPRLTYRLTSFEEALPGAFSAASFMPDAVDRVLGERAGPRLPESRPSDPPPDGP